MKLISYMLFLFIIVVIIRILPVYLKYKKSSYKNYSNSSLLKVATNTGLLGEFLIFYLLEKKFPEAKILPNVYIPKENDETTEIDLLMINEKGIYVFESKNYGGWIYGNGKRKNWTQTFGKGKKNRFYNPVWQNYGHINALVEYLDLPGDIFKSIIVFSKRCTLKKISKIDDDVLVLRRPRLINKIKKMNKVSEDILTNYEISEIYELLLQNIMVSDEMKEKHISDIKRKLG
ncbi:nuclease-related domain-containing protein [Clostridiaceae bacterium HSG29]|nr:nuclease-related domain-containing protein [Clostridiaceae bacterium HSG29]